MSALTILFGLFVAVVGTVNSAVPKTNKVAFYVLKQGNLTVNFTNFGARVVSLYYPDRYGNLADIVLGYDSLEEMTVDKFNLNAIVGRVANRIGLAQFTLNGTRYKLPANEGRTMFNGGSKGFGYVFWKMTKLIIDKRFSEITFTYRSFDGEEGFPGDLTVEVIHRVISYRLNTTITARVENKATPINIGQHMVFNLGGHNSGNVLEQDLQIYGPNIVELNKDLLPTGKLKVVNNTGYDFQKPQTIGNNLKKEPNGYTINYVLKRGFPIIGHDKKSGRMVLFRTTAPTLHMCISNKVKDVHGKGGFIYQPHAGFALDGQDYPDAVNHPEFPPIIYNKGQVFTRINTYTFKSREYQ